MADAVMAAVTAILYWVESEFLSLVGGACGPNASAMAMSWADQRYHATRDVFLQFKAIGACAANGVSTGGGLARGLLHEGYKIHRQYPAGDWLGFLKGEIIKPAAVVVELAQAHHLRDAITGAGMDAGPTLGYHYICALIYHPGGHSVRAGKMLGEGFWCADGDSDATNPIVGGRRTRVAAGHALQFYPVETLRAAEPCDLIAVYPRVPIPASSSLDVAPAPVPAPPPQPQPQIHEPAGLPGWKDDGHTLVAPNGVAVVRGFREHVIERAAEGHWQGGEPYVEEYNDGGDGSVQEFAAALLLWNPRQNVYEGTLEDALRIAAHEHEGKAA